MVPQKNVYFLHAFFFFNLMKKVGYLLFSRGEM